MILPRIRASLGRSDALALVELLGRDDPEIRRAARERLEDAGIDALLDDPRTPAALMTASGVALGPPVVFYVLVRHALLEGGVEHRGTADYLASLVVAFGSGNRAWRISDRPGEEFRYLVDLIARMGDDDGEEAFLIQSHLGNFALWLTGLFPDFLEGRRQRRGAPSYRYYEAMGSAGFRLAASTAQAENLGLDELLREVADSFPRLRIALNRVSDRHMWRGGADPVGRLLRGLEGRGN